MFYSSQKEEKVLFRCTYDEEYGKKVDNKKQDVLYLDIGASASAFYSHYEKAAWDVMDKMFAEGRSFEEARAAVANDPRSYQSMRIYKHMPERNMLTFTDRELIDYKYIEKMVLPQWQIISEEKEILGYKCQQAQTELYGRKWTVWFAPDIPISDGPWKFHGLPGLILEAVDSNNYFHFTCIEIEKMDTSNRMISIPKKKYVKCTRKELIQAKRENRKDVIAYTYKVWGIKSKMYDANGRETKPTPQELFYIEDDIK